MPRVRKHHDTAPAKPFPKVPIYTITTLKAILPLYVHFSLEMGIYSCIIHNVDKGAKQTTSFNVWVVTVCVKELTNHYIILATMINFQIIIN